MIETKDLDEMTCVNWFDAGEWAFQYDGSWTRIVDEDGEQVTMRMAQLTREEVMHIQDGYRLGLRRGIVRGEIQKQNEVRRALGI